MFQGKTLWQIFSMGGFTMYILLICSILSVTFIIERFLKYRLKSRLKRADFMSKIKQTLKTSGIDVAIKLCETYDTPISNVVHSGLKLYRQPEKEVSNSMEREITIETISLERNTSIVGTIGNIAVYIGLFGTVLGIVRSFHDISRLGAGGMNVVIGGVSEALICTATGLLVAIPSVIAYNYFVKKIDNFVNEMEICASEIIDITGSIKTGPLNK